MPCFNEHRPLDGWLAGDWWVSLFQPPPPQRKDILRIKRELNVSKVPPVIPIVRCLFFLLFISSHWRGVEGGGSDTLTYWKQGIKEDRVMEEGVLDDSLSLILELSHESDTSCKTHQPVCCSKRRSSSVEAWCCCPINQIPL